MENIPNKLIFIIENDHQTRVNLRIFYETRGHKVVSAANTIDAKKLLDGQLKPDLILIGRKFPIQSSSILISIFETDERFKNVPIVALQKTGETLSKRFTLNVRTHDPEALLSILN